MLVTGASGVDRYGVGVGVGVGVGRVPGVVLTVAPADRAGVDVAEVTGAAGVIVTAGGVSDEHSGICSPCRRRTMRSASVLLLAVIPDSTCDCHDGTRSAMVRSVFSLTSENLIGPKAALTPR